MIDSTEEEQEARERQRLARTQQEIADAQAQALANQPVPSTTAESSLSGQGGASPSLSGSGTEPLRLGAEESTLGNIAQGAGEIGGQLIGGAFDGLDAMFNLAHDIAPDTFDEVDIFPNIDRLHTQDDVVSGKITQQEFDDQVVNAGVAEFARGAAQFGVGVMPGLGFLKIAKGAATGLKAYKAAQLLGGAGAAGMVTRGAVWGGVADFMAFDGNEGRVTDILDEFSEEYPWMENLVIDGLKSKGDISKDPETGKMVYMEEDGLGGRIKNTIEGGIMGVTIDMLGVGIKALRGSNNAVTKAGANGNALIDIAPAKSDYSNLTSIGADMDALTRYEQALGTNISDPAALRASVEQIRLANPELADAVSGDVRQIQSLKAELAGEMEKLSDGWVKTRTSETAAKLTDETWEDMDEVAKQYLTGDQLAAIDKYKSIPRSAREKALLASAENTADRNRFQQLLAKDQLELDAIENGFGAHTAPPGLSDIDSKAFQEYSEAMQTGNFGALTQTLRDGGKIPMVKAPQLRGGSVEEFLAQSAGVIKLDDASLIKATRAAGLGDGAALKAGTGLTDADRVARQALTDERAALKTKRAPKGASAEAKAAVKQENKAIRAQQKALDTKLAETETLARGQRKAGDNSMTNKAILERAAKERRLLKSNSPESVQRWADFMEGRVATTDVAVMTHIARQTKMGIDASLVKYSIDENQLGTLPIEALAEFQELLQLSGRLHDAINGHASVAGGNLRALRMSPKSSGAAAESWVRNLKQAESFANGTSAHEVASRQMAAILGATDDMLADVISKQTKPGAMDKALHYWTNSLLSGTQTLSIQPISAAMMTVYMPFEAAIGASMRGDLKAAGAELRGLYGLVKSFQGVTKAISGTVDNVEKLVPQRNGTQVLANTKAAFKSAQGQLDSRTLMDEGTRALGQGDILMQGSAMDKLGKAAETVVGLPSRLIATTDEFSKGLNYNVKLMQDGYKAAATDGVANATEAATAHMNKVVNWDTLEDPIERAAFRKYHDEAVEYARSATFQTEASPDGITKSVQGFVARHPMARIVMPFVRTPSNILKFAWERTPILARLIKEDQAILKAGTDVAKINAIHARRQVGTALWATALVAGSEGRITGGAPREPGARAAFEAAGLQEYSVALGENEDGSTNWYSFKRTDPFGMFLGVSADLAQLFQEMDSEDASVQEIVSAAGTALVENVKSRSYVQGISQLLGALQEPDRRGEAYVGSLAQNVIPNILSQVRRYGAFGEADPMREVNGILDRMRNRIPGVSDALAPKLNIFGKPMYTNTGTIPGADMINPFFHTKSQFGPDQVKALRRGELLLSDIGDDTTDAGKMDRVSAAALMIDFKWNMKTRYKHIDGVELTPEQKNKWIKLSSDGLEKQLANLVDSPTWKYASKPKPGDEDLSGQYLLFKRLIEAKRARAKAQLIYSDEALQLKLKQQRQEKRASQNYRPDDVLAGR